MNLNSLLPPSPSKPPPFPSPSPSPIQYPPPSLLLPPPSRLPSILVAYIVLALLVIVAPYLRGLTGHLYTVVATSVTPIRMEVGKKPPSSQDGPKYDTYGLAVLSSQSSLLDVWVHTGTDVLYPATKHLVGSFIDLAMTLTPGESRGKPVRSLGTVRKQKKTGTRANKSVSGISYVFSLVLSVLSDRFLAITALLSLCGVIWYDSKHAPPNLFIARYITVFEVVVSYGAALFVRYILLIALNTLQYCAYLSLLMVQYLLRYSLWCTPVRALMKPLVRRCIRAPYAALSLVLPKTFLRLCLALLQMRLLVCAVLFLVSYFFLQNVISSDPERVAVYKESRIMPTCSYVLIAYTGLFAVLVLDMVVPPETIRLLQENAGFLWVRTVTDDEYDVELEEEELSDLTDGLPEADVLRMRHRYSITKNQEKASNGGKSSSQSLSAHLMLTCRFISALHADHMTSLVLLYLPLLLLAIPSVSFGVEVISGNPLKVAAAAGMFQMFSPELTNLALCLTAAGLHLLIARQKLSLAWPVDWLEELIGPGSPAFPPCASAAKQSLTAGTTVRASGVTPSAVALFYGICGGSSASRSQEGQGGALGGAASPLSLLDGECVHEDGGRTAEYVRISSDAIEKVREHVYFGPKYVVECCFCSTDRQLKRVDEWCAWCRCRECGGHTSLAPGVEADERSSRRKVPRCRDRDGATS